MNEFLIRNHKIDTIGYLRYISNNMVWKWGNAKDTSIVEIDENVVACSLAF